MLAILLGVVALASAQVSVLNQTQYLGHWVQVYSDLVVDATFENSSFCDTADYALYPNTTISVWNRERQFNTSGPERQIFGWASAEDPAKPGELTVHLETTGFPAPYWVYQLGPVVNDQYQYSIVSDPLKLTLFVLARNVSTFFNQYNTEVLRYLNETGFTEVWNRPILTVQDGCRPFPTSTIRTLV
jgi:apolipoprotein D and lipocalin family protein